MPRFTETKKLLPVINNRKPIGQLLMNLFFGKTKTHHTDVIEVDVKVAKRVMAPFVSPAKGGKVMKREGFDTRTVKLPKIAPERLTTIEDVSATGAGETEYSTKSIAQRQKEIAVNDLKELDDSILRREEWMCREVILNKEVLIKGDDIEKHITFSTDDKVVLSGTSLWNNAESDPIADLQNYQQAVMKASGVKPKIVLMDSASGAAFIGNAKVKDAFDKKSIILGQLQPSVKNDNVTFYGKINLLNLELYTYDEWFVDDEGNEVPMIPNGTVILGSRNIGTMNYAAVKQMENKKFVNIEAKRVPKHIIDEDNETEKLRLSSRPLPTPNDTKSWKVLKVL